MKSLICFFSVLKTLIHDPLVEWEKVKGHSSCESPNKKVLVSFVFEMFIIMAVML